MGNPFARQENWIQWVAAAAIGAVLVVLMFVVMSKLGHSNRPDVERAMEPPPREPPPAAAPSPPATSPPAVAPGTP
jgi:hypothetical protein